MARTVRPRCRSVPDHQPLDDNERRRQGVPPRPYDQILCLCRQHDHAFQLWLNSLVATLHIMYIMGCGRHLNSVHSIGAYNVQCSVCESKRDAHSSKLRTGGHISVHGRVLRPQMPAQHTTQQHKQNQRPRTVIKFNCVNAWFYRSSHMHVDTCTCLYTHLLYTTPLLFIITRVLHSWYSL